VVQANGKVRDRLEVPGPADLEVADAGLSGEHHQTAARPDVASSSAACGPAIFRARLTENPWPASWPQ